MIRNKRTVFGALFLFALAAILCVNGAAACAENDDPLREFNEWREYLAGKWRRFDRLEAESDWFSVFKLPSDVYAFYEMPYEQDACCFLIPGKEKALLWDTGMGIEKLRPLVETCTDLPIIVLNSHDHFDHIGGNAEFDEVWCYDSDSAKQHLADGPNEEELAELAEEMAFVSMALGSCSAEVPDHIPGKAPTGTVTDGQLIDLGERTLEVMYTPGHAASSIMLLDAENGLLFTGDTYYPGPLLVMFQDSSFPDYVDSVRKAADRAVSERVEWVFGSHNYMEKGVSHLCRLADFLEGIREGNITEYEIEDGFRCYIMDDDISVCLPDD